MVDPVMKSHEDLMALSFELRESCAEVRATHRALVEQSKQERERSRALQAQLQESWDLLKKTVPRVRHSN